MSEAADKLKAKGYEWAALEMDDGDTGPYNRAIWPEFCEQFRIRGMMTGPWYTSGDNIRHTPPDADFSIAEIEGPGDYEGVAYVIDHGELPSCPVATVTNFSTLTREMADKLIRAGFSCLPEAYLNENPNASPDRVDFTARNLGWPTSQPVAGVYPVGGQPPPSYAQWADWPLADYLGEYVI